MPELEWEGEWEGEWEREPSGNYISQPVHHGGKRPGQSAWSIRVNPDEVRHATRVVAAAAFAAYVGMIVLSNFLLQHFGLLHAFGTGMLVPAGTFCAALTFPLRDTVQRLGGFGAGAFAVLAGAAISWRISPTLAAASGLAYLLSETTDLVVYSALWRRSLLIAFLASGIIASVVDSVVFLGIAGIPWATAGPGLLAVKWTMQALAFPLVLWLRTLAPQPRPTKRRALA